MRRVAGWRWPTWLLLVVLIPLSVYGWAPDGLLESWYAPVHVVWAIACGAGLYFRVPRGAGRCFRVDASLSREARDGLSRSRGARGLVAYLPTLLLVAGVYGAAALVSWRARGWSAHPDRMPGPASGHPDLGALDALAFLAAATVLAALWLRSVGGLRGFRSHGLDLDPPESPGGRVFSNEGGSPC